MKWFIGPPLSTKPSVTAGFVLITLMTSLTFVKSDDDDQIFYAVTSPYIGLVSSGISWSVSSRGECANFCLSKKANCISFYYNSYNGLCVPGSLTHKTDAHYTANQAAGAILYHKNNYCDEVNSFYLAELNDAFTCLYFYWTTPLTYEAAIDECHQQDAELPTIKTAKGLDDFNRLQMGNPIYCWIGLDNRNTGTVLTWYDTNTALSASETSALFDASQPDNSGGNGNSCCYFNPAWSKFDDASCSEVKNVVCYKDVNVS